MNTYFGYTFSILEFLNIKTKMTIITIETHDTKYSTNTKHYTPELVNWNAVMKVMNQDSKYIIRILTVG